MKIIKPADKIYKCPTCGTEFVMEKGDSILYHGGRHGCIPYVACPICGYEILWPSHSKSDAKDK